MIPLVGWKPNPGAQRLFLRCPVFEVLLEGNRGGGKTDALIMDFLQFVGMGFGRYWRGLLLRETFPNLAEVIEKTHRWIPLIFPGARYNNSEYFWRFPGGELLKFGYGKSERDYWQYHGHEWPWLGWEELTNWASPALYLKMLSVCRSPYPGIPKHVRATCNPWGKGHNWVKRRWRITELLPGRVQKETMKSEETGLVISITRCYIHSKREENKPLILADPQYELNLHQNKDPNIKKAWVKGSWEIVAGGMFDDLWDPGVHVLPRINIPGTWYIDRTFDYGSSAPFSVGWFAQTNGSPVDITYVIYTPAGNMEVSEQRTFPKGTLIRFWELYGCVSGQENKGLRWTAKEIGEAIKQEEEKIFSLFRGIKKVNPGPADSSIWDADQRNESIIKDINSGFGNPKSKDIFCKSNKAAGTRKKRWELIRGRLKNSLLFPMEDKGLFITEDCVDFKRIFPCLPRDEKDLDDLDTDSEDHQADETGYRCLHNPVTSEPVKVIIG